MGPNTWWGMAKVKQLIDHSRHCVTELALTEWNTHKSNWCTPRTVPSSGKKFPHPKKQQLEMLLLKIPRGTRDFGIEKPLLHKCLLLYCVAGKGCRICMSEANYISYLINPDANEVAGQHWVLQAGRSSLAEVQQHSLITDSTWPIPSHTCAKQSGTGRSAQREQQQNWIRALQRSLLVLFGSLFKTKQENTEWGITNHWSSHPGNWDSKLHLWLALGSRK